MSCSEFVDCYDTFPVHLRNGCMKSKPVRAFERFEDALEDLQPENDALESPTDTANVLSSVLNGKAVDLKDALADAKIAIDTFFNNDFEVAKKQLEPLAHCSPYHALGNGTFAYLQAIMTFDQGDIENASKILKQSIDVCNAFRRKNNIVTTLGKMVRKTDYDSYTLDEIHAELCYAECLLLKAVLTFTEDETLVSFVKGGLKIKACHSSYRECWNILQNRQWGDEATKIHFQSGVLMGSGSFNLMVSLLPGRILKLLEFVGFSGDRDVGLADLEKGYSLQGSLRSIMCAMVLLAYHLLITYVLSYKEGDLEMAERILQDKLALYPKGVWFLFFQGRLRLVQGRTEEAIEAYTKAWKSQDVWPHFHHFCYWELMWSHGFRGEWSQAAHYAGTLLAESRWSKCIYAYQQGAFMCMQTLNEAEKKEMISLMEQAPTWKQRIAGKSLPMEKFVLRKCARFFAQQQQLLLPAVELIYLWNAFKIVGKQWHLVKTILKLVETAAQNFPTFPEYRYDNEALAVLLKGMCLKAMDSPLQAEECFMQVAAMGKKIVDDTYLVPYSVAELGFLYLNQGKTEQAVQFLEKAKNEYKGYLLESRLHFRIHSALNDLRAK